MLIPSQRKRPNRNTRLSSISKLAEALPDEALQNLHEFAEFLAEKYPSPVQVNLEYVPLPRPEGESVIAAIKRLSKSYPMVDSTSLFDQTSAIMSAHILQDVSKQDSINKLEAIFAEKYQAYIADQSPG